MEPETGLESVETYVPQRGAMLLIDRIIELSEEHAVAEVDIRSEGLFMRKGKMPAWVGIEYMAQTISAWAGGRSQRSGGKTKIGLLLGSRRYEAMQPAFPAGSTLRVEVRRELAGESGLGVFDGRILVDGALIASAKVTVFEPADDMEWIRQLQRTQNTNG